MLTSDYIRSAGGVLAALSQKSAEYIGSLIPSREFKGLGAKSGNLEQLIVHAAPHLDEYFAILAFRACVPESVRLLPLNEGSLLSHNNDSRAKQIWPRAALFGLGGTHKGGARPLFMYDEHKQQGESRDHSSAAQMVLRHLLKHGNGSLPYSISRIFLEVDHIDANGHAHPQHLSQLIKSLHETEFIFHRGNSSLEDVKDYLTANWKQAIIEATLAAIIYCMQNRIDLNDKDALKQAVTDSIKHYEGCSFYKIENGFREACQRLRSNALNFGPVFQEAVLKETDASGEIRPKLFQNAQGKVGKRQQLAMLSRMALACNACWGAILSQIIMYHYYESLVYTQLSYQKVMSELQNNLMPNPRDLNIITQVGELSFRKLDNIVATIEREDPKTKQKSAVNRPLWLLGLDISPDVVAPNRAMTSFINNHNAGFGLAFIKNSRLETRSIFRTNNFPYERWKRLVDRLMTLEGDSDNLLAPGCWHKTLNPKREYAPFLINGNRAHQYVPRSNLEIEVLVDLMQDDYRHHP